LISTNLTDGELKESACYKAVQGKITTGYDDNTRWALQNAANLCEYFPNSTNPAICLQGFRDVADKYKPGFPNDIILCSRAKEGIDAWNIASCYVNYIDAGESADQAFDKCKAYRPVQKYVIVNAFHANLVLDASASDKNRLQLWTNEVDSDEFVPNANNQKWVVTEMEDGFVKLSNSHYKNNVLDASAGTKGKVQLFEDLEKSNEYVPDARNQKWKFEPLGNGLYKIRNAHFSAMVLEASASDTGKIQLWEDLGDANTYVPKALNQKWYLVPAN